MCSVLIVYTSEAQDWASYLKLILEASHHFPQDSILFYLVDEHSVQDEDYSLFSTSQCILLLLSVAFLDIQSEPAVRNTLKKFLYPPSKIVAFLCGVSESDGLIDYFEHWNSWKKLDSDDEPALYVSTVCDVIEEGMYFFIMEKKNLVFLMFLVYLRKSKKGSRYVKKLNLFTIQPSQGLLRNLFFLISGQYLGL